MQEKAPERGTIQSVDQAFRIVHLLCDCDGAGVTELAAELGVAKSTVHRHLTTMRRHGYVVREDGEYHVGLRFLEPGLHARTRKDVYELVGKNVETLADKTGERVQHIVEENGRGIHAFVSVGESGLRTEMGVGVRVPLHATSVGKAILAYTPDDRVDEILDRHGLPRLTDNTLTTREDLFAALERVRERGVAYNDAERIDGIFSVGVPIRGPGGELYGGISVTGPNRRMKERRVDALTEQLLSAAEDIRLRIQYSEL